MAGSGTAQLRTDDALLRVEHLVVPDLCVLVEQPGSRRHRHAAHSLAQQPQMEVLAERDPVSGLLERRRRRLPKPQQLGRQVAPVEQAARARMDSLLVETGTQHGHLIAAA